MPKVSSKRTLPRWRIIRLKATPAVELGTVEASDADKAIELAIKEFEITNPQHQRRLAARRGSIRYWPLSPKRDHSHFQ